MADPHAFDIVLRALLAPFNGHFDVVAGAEARGFLLAGAAAARTGCGLVPIRKAGKLPRPAASRTYELEYGTATLELQRDLAPGTRVLILDDVLATGGTLVASCELVRELGYEVAGIAVVLELEALGGRTRLAGENLHAVTVIP
jgi:adenine phosphoribosyltransferase